MGRGVDYFESASKGIEFSFLNECVFSAVLTASLDLKWKGSPRKAMEGMEFK